MFYKTLLGAIASVKVKLPKGCSITPQGVFHYTHRYGWMKRTLASLHHWYEHMNTCIHVYLKTWHVVNLILILIYVYIIELYIRNNSLHGCLIHFLTIIFHIKLVFITSFWIMMFLLWVLILFCHKVFVYTPYMYKVLLYTTYINKV